MTVETFLDVWGDTHTLTTTAKWCAQQWEKYQEHECEAGLFLEIKEAEFLQKAAIYYAEFKRKTFVVSEYDAEGTIEDPIKLRLIKRDGLYKNWDAAKTKLLHLAQGYTCEKGMDNERVYLLRDGSDCLQSIIEIEKAG